MPANLERVQVDLGDRSYSIEIGMNLWSHLAESIHTQFKTKRLVVITDETVAALYGTALIEILKEYGFLVTCHQMPAGEIHKNLTTVQTLYHEILEQGCDRKTPVIALGGGVPGDTAGFVAATLLRGLPFIQVPTTLLAMVDSSVGGKTGVDMPQGKNLVGAFHQPSLVVISVETLKTLPLREIRAGMAEVVKYGMIWDSALFDLLARDGSKVTPPTSGELDFALMSHIIRRCCEIKAEVVSKDERESGLREILNFGHTVGHALEAATEYGLLLHGEAVALGMVVETLLAEKRGMVSSEVSVRLCRLLVDLGLPVELPSCDLGQIWSLMHSDKKAREGSIRMVLPIGIGQVETVAGISQDELVAAWKGTS